ncbi:MAG: TonB-dependent receptor [Thermoflavifilum sp.]|nr:TonB-dependent receptor [Thermoflavifilum sp.]
MKQNSTHYQKWRMKPLAFLLFFLLPSFLQAQQRQSIQGRVFESNGRTPLAGVTVLVQGTQVGTVTDNQGQYSIEASPEDSLIFRYVGYQERHVRVGDQHVINVSLLPATSSLNELVVIGYGTVQKKDLTGSVSVVNMKDAEKNPTYDVARMLQGQVAGISVHGSGEPGGYVQIKLRGITTFGNNSPLFVVDGVPVDAPFDFSTDDIESIQILKDASAAAIYGARAATGVIIITTKKGKPGPLRVNYSGYYGWQHIPKYIPVTNREQYQKITTAAELNAGLTIAPANDPSNPKYISNINTDWQKAALKTGIIQDHHLNLSGGSESINYDLGLSYFNQTGIQVGPQKYDRYTMNANFGGHKGKFEYGAKLAYTQSHKGNYAATQGHAVFGGTVTAMLTAIPTVPVYDSTRLGGYGGSDAALQRAISANVVGINNLVKDYSDRNRALGNIWAELELIKNLKYKLNLSYDRTDYKNYHFEPKFDMGYYYINNTFYLSEQLGNANTGLIENTLTYHLQAGKHQIDFLAGMTYQEDHNQWMQGTAQDTTNLQFQTFSAVSNPAAKGLSSYLEASTLLSYLGRINYNYDDRYLFTVNFRRDGSSRFSPLNRFGNFAGFAAAWNITNEKFIKLPKFISNLKIRGSYGELGNQNFGNYLYQSYIDNSVNYDFNDQLAIGATTVSVADPSLKWESTIVSDVGLDASLFNEALSFTIEYFNRESKDIITNIPIPYSVGSFPQTVTTNAASLRNTGFELTATYRNSFGKLHYSITFNGSTLQNKVIKLGGANNPIYGSASKSEVGHPVGEIFGYLTEGIFQDANDVAKHATQTGAAPGDIKFKDVNGDGVITDQDRVYLGNAIPKYYYGLNIDLSYANFDFSMFWQGNAGNKVFNAVYQALMAEQYGNDHIDALNYWTPTNTHTNVPRPIIGDPNGNDRVSNRFVEDGSYVRLQNLQIGYTLPESIVKRTHLFGSFHIYLAGENLITISSYKGYDPDFISDGLFSRGFDYGSFPNPRTIMLGIQAGF